MDSITVVAGIPIPSRSPIFLGLVGVHVLLGTTCVGTGLLAMLSNKGREGTRALAPFTSGACWRQL
jgi:hypothetical protein